MAIVKTEITKNKDSNDNHNINSNDDNSKRSNK